MLLLNALSTVVTVASSVAALNVPRDSTSNRVYEKINGPPAGWSIDESSPIDKDLSMIKLRVQLVPQNMDKFHELAMNVQDPFTTRALLLISRTRLQLLVMHHTESTSPSTSLML
jgi:tripeptidyl-peptidase-1